MSKKTGMEEEHETRLRPVGEGSTHRGLVTRVERVQNRKNLQISRARTAVNHSLAEAWVAANIPSTEIRQIEAVAIDVFGLRELGRRWLEQPNLATHNLAPISLLGSEGGYKHVHQLLMRIESGNLA